MGVDLELYDTLQRVSLAIFKSFQPPFTDKHDGAAHKMRSVRWLDAIEEGLLGLAKSKVGNAVSYSARNKENFLSRKKGEFLFDIVICEADWMGERLWAVESEFAASNAHIRRDFAKLMWADVKNRLFICNDSKRLTEIENVTHRIKMSDGNLFLFQMPHPGSWHDPGPHEVLLRKYEDGQWRKVR